MYRRVTFPILLAACAVVAGCAQSTARDTTLYAELGGDAGIEAIVQQLLLNIAADDRIRHHFRDVHIAGFRDRLENHFCQVSGGPCAPPKRSMHESHRLLGIRSGDFNALVEGLIAAMESRGIDYGTQNEFLALLVPMQDDIVSDG